MFQMFSLQGLFVICDTVYGIKLPAKPVDVKKYHFLFFTVNKTVILSLINNPKIQGPGPNKIPDFWIRNFSNFCQSLRSLQACKPWCMNENMIGEATCETSAADHRDRSGTNHRVSKIHYFLWFLFLENESIRELHPPSDSSRCWGI